VVCGLAIGAGGGLKITALRGRQAIVEGVRSRSLKEDQVHQQSGGYRSKSPGHLMNPSQIRCPTWRMRQVSPQIERRLKTTQAGPGGASSAAAPISIRRKIL
jgi:hypothetical protein